MGSIIRIVMNNLIEKHHSRRVLLRKFPRLCRRISIAELDLRRKSTSTNYDSPPLISFVQ